MRNLVAVLFLMLVSAPAMADSSDIYATVPKELRVAAHELTDLMTRLEALGTDWIALRKAIGAPLSYYVKSRGKGSDTERVERYASSSSRTWYFDRRKDITERYIHTPGGTLYLKQGDGKLEIYVSDGHSSYYKKVIATSDGTTSREEYVNEQGAKPPFEPPNLP